MDKPAILIVEDGNEYFEIFSRFVTGPIYHQAHNGDEALEILKCLKIDIIFMDMRFDRIPQNKLLGNHAQITHLCNGDPNRAWQYLQNNQGLYILEAMKNEGFFDLKIIISYDFSREESRFLELKKTYPKLEYLADTHGTDALYQHFEILLGKK